MRGAPDEAHVERRTAAAAWVAPPAEAQDGGAGALLPPLVLALAGIGICVRGDPSGTQAGGHSAAAVQLDLLLGGALAVCGLAVVLAVWQARRGNDPPRMRSFAIAGSVGLCVLPLLLWRVGIHTEGALAVGLIGVWSFVGALRLSAGPPEIPLDDPYVVARSADRGWGSRVGLVALGVVLLPNALFMVMGHGWLIHVHVGADIPSALSGNVKDVTRTLSGSRVTFRFEQDVPDGTMQDVQDGVALAEAYYLRTFGSATRQPVVVEVRGSSSLGMRVGGYTADHRIVLATISAVGGPFSSLYLRQAAAHELFHVLQYELSDGRLIGSGPDWLVEGGAEFASLSVLIDDGELSYGDMVSCEVLALAAGPSQQAPLQGLFAQAAMLHQMQQSYALATLGVDNVTETRGIMALGIYFRGLATSDWKSAFRTAFGRSADTFYAEFADARGDFPPPHRSGCNFYYDG